jgi:hypothetical protein
MQGRCGTIDLMVFLKQILYTCTFQKEVIFDDALIKSNIFIVSDSKKQSIFHDPSGLKSA